MENDLFEPLWNKADEQVANALNVKKLIEKLKHIDIPIGIDISVLNDSVLFRISDIKKLHDVRFLLKKIYQQWEDKIENRWFACGHTLTSWGCDANRHVDIWLESPIENYPDELVTKKCNWKKSSFREESYDFVCAMEEK